MNLHRKMHTDRRLWLLFGVVAFVLLGFVHPQNEAVEYKVGPSNFWGVLFDPHIWRSRETLVVLPAYTTLLAVPAAVLGWVAQAIVVAIRFPSVYAPKRAEGNSLGREPRVG